MRGFASSISRVGLIVSACLPFRLLRHVHFYDMSCVGRLSVSKVPGL